MENVVGKIKSIKQNQQEDVFNNPKPFDKDHIWPVSKDGSDIKENKTKLSKKTNSSKKGKTKGNINNIRFSVEKYTYEKNNHQYICGRLYIKFKKGWYEVIR